MVQSDTEFDLLDPNEDISAFFEVLDEDLELGEVVVGMVEEVSTSEASSEEKGESSQPQFVCKYCDKVTKSKGGLTRHMSSMHVEYHYENYYQSKLDGGSLHNLIKKAIAESLKKTSAIQKKFEIISSVITTKSVKRSLKKLKKFLKSLKNLEMLVNFLTVFLTHLLLIHALTFHPYAFLLLLF